MSLVDLDDNEEITLSKSQINLDSLEYQLGDPIIYSSKLKKFFVSGGTNSGNPFLGVCFEYRENNGQKLVNVLYKGFILHDNLVILGSLKENYISAFIQSEFEKYKNYIKKKMPRSKRLKRINLKMLDKKQTQILYNNFDKIINGYELGIGYEYSQILKAQIVTTPFYILDQGKIKEYHFDTNELKDPEYEGANFFCYFTFQI